ncbi:hypothetical protein OSB04_011158 [Centaurea solstitialis]|uniref:Uncharacterized protein n=1 Tax=Centaurea solstitialis TaxID=347529 RepID=A0AA38T8X1_9ASTR|nr:hypothetical protein OSB04_011158 [Centaurea solstitialis]
MELELLFQVLMKSLLVARRQGSIMSEFRRRTRSFNNNRTIIDDHDSSVNDFDELTWGEIQQVLMEENGNSRSVILNRPSFLNALTISMKNDKNTGFSLGFNEPVGWLFGSGTKSNRIHIKQNFIKTGTGEGGGGGRNFAGGEFWSVCLSNEFHGLPRPPSLLSFKFRHSLRR